MKKEDDMKDILVTTHLNILVLSHLFFVQSIICIFFIFLFLYYL